MKKIRCSVFETNSSSSHSISINGTLNSEILPSKIRRFQNEHADDIDDKIHVHLGLCEFGWGYEEFTDSWKKLCYAMMMCVETECKNCETINNVYQTEGFRLIQSIFDKKIVLIGKWNIEKYEKPDGSEGSYLNHDGYIDHQSWEGYSSLKDFLDKCGLSITDFIFDENVELIIDNDNR